MTVLLTNLHISPPGPDLPMATPVAGVATPNDVSGTRDFDTVSIESCGLSPAALQNIREQMALSLERTKELEDQVKLIPGLKVRLLFDNVFAKRIQGSGSIIHN